MASEILSVPEEHLEQVIRVLRAGVQICTLRRQIVKEVRAELLQWCEAEEEYLNRE